MFSRAVARRTANRNPRTNLNCRPLEERLTPADCYWAGGSDFNDPNSWLNGVAPGSLDGAFFDSKYAGTTIGSSAGISVAYLSCPASINISSGHSFYVGGGHLDGKLTVTNGDVSASKADYVAFKLGGGLVCSGGSIGGNLLVYGALVATNEQCTGIVTANDGGTLAGTLNVSSGIMELHNGNYVLDGLSETGAGELRLVGNASASNVTVANFTQNAGVLSGSGTLTITNSFTWGGGTQSGPGTTIIPAGASAMINGFTDVLDARHFVNGGTTTWSAGYLYMSNAATIDNQLGALFDAQSGYAITLGAGVGDPLFTNEGTLRRSGNGNNSQISNVPFVSSNLVDVQAGTLSIGGGSAEFAGSLTVAGTLRIASPAATLDDGLVESGTGTMVMDGGNVTIPALAKVAATNFVQNAGILTGPGLLTIGNSFTWAGGTQSGTGTTTIPSTCVATFTGAVQLYLTLDARHFNNGNSVTWTGGYIVMSNGATFDNLGATIDNPLGALFDAQATATMSAGNGVAPLFTNAGTFRRSGNMNTTNINVPFISSKLVDVQAGGLKFGGASAEFGGSLTVAGTVILYSQAVTLDDQLTESGAGVLELDGGNATIPTGAKVSSQNFIQNAGNLTGAGQLTINNTYSWTGGMQSGTGSTIIPVTCVATFSDATQSYLTLDGRHIFNGGSVTWIGAEIDMKNGATFDNLGGALFDAQSSRLIQNAGGIGTPMFNNAGTFRRSGNANTTTINVPFISTTQVDVQVGSLNFGAATAEFAGLLTVASTLNLNGADVTLDNGLAETGAGLLALLAGTATLPTNAKVSAQNFLQYAGTLTGAGDITITPHFTWASGTQSGTGRTIIPVEADAKITGTTFNIQTLDARRIINSGSMTWSGGYINMDNGASISNLAGALFDAQAVQAMQRATNVGTALFNNAGTLRRSGNNFTTTIQVPFANTGTIDVKAGTLDTPGTLTLSGILTGSGTLASPVNDISGSVRPGDFVNNVTGSLTVVGDYSQDGSGELRVALNGTVAKTSYDQLAVVGKVSLGGILTPSINYAAQINDTFIIIDNDGTSDLVAGTFAGLPDGAFMTLNNGSVAQISYHGGDGNDVTLTITTPPTGTTARVAGLQVNDGSVQRSRLTSLQVTFNQIVTLPDHPADAFTLKRQSDNASVMLNASVSNGPTTVVTLTFTGGPLEYGSLADGRYTLNVLASQINAGSFDGNGDNMTGDDYSLVGSPANGLFRLFGDSDGNGTVNAADFLAFRSAFGGNSATFDFNNNGSVDASDFLAFRSRFGSSV